MITNKEGFMDVDLLAAKVVAKWLTATDLMRVVSLRVTLLMEIWLIVLDLPFHLADRWKNLMFLFPSNSHWILDFYFQ